MSNEIDEDAEIAKALGLDKVVPEVYVDLLQPAVKELGKGLEITAKAVNVALAPLHGMVWGSEKIKNYLTVGLTRRLKDIPIENIQSPKPNIAGPTIEALRFCANEIELRELFVNLLATSINSEHASKAHPAFVEVINQITPDEAKILQHLSKNNSSPLIVSSTVKLGWWTSIVNESLLNDFIRICEIIKLDFPNQISSYLDNLRRLQLLEITYEYDNSLENKIRRARNDTDKLMRSFNHDSGRIEQLTFTSFGLQFVFACIDVDIDPVNN